MIIIRSSEVFSLAVVHEVTFEQREDGRYFRKFATVGELVDVLQKLPRDYKIFHRNCYESDSPSLYYFGDKSFEIL